MVCSMFSCLQNCLTIFDLKSNPALETIFFASSNFTNTILAFFTRSSTAGLLAFLYNRKLSNLQCTEVFYFQQRSYQCQPPLMACTVLHMELPSLVVVSADIPSMWHTALQCFWCLHSYSPNTLIPWLKVFFFFNAYIVAVQLFHYLSLQ